RALQLPTAVLDPGDVHELLLEHGEERHEVDVDQVAGDLAIAGHRQRPPLPRVQLHAAVPAGLAFGQQVRRRELEVARVELGGRLESGIRRLEGAAVLRTKFGPEGAGGERVTRPDSRIDRAMMPVVRQGWSLIDPHARGQKQGIRQADPRLAEEAGVVITTAIRRDRAAGPETAEVRGRALIAETIL